MVGKILFPHSVFKSFEAQRYGDMALVTQLVTEVGWQFRPSDEGEWYPRLRISDGSIIFWLLVKLWMSFEECIRLLCRLH